jgi:hypothetical protein
MFLRVPTILKEFDIPKSTLFKAIHENRIRSIRINRQYFVYWIDVRDYLIHNILPNLLWWATIRIPSPLPKGVVTLSDACQTMNISKRQWSVNIKHLLPKEKQLTWESIDCGISVQKSMSVVKFGKLCDSIKKMDGVFNKQPVHHLIFSMSVDGEISFVEAEPPQIVEVNN